MVTQLNDAAFQAEVLGKPGYALVDFAAVWCGPCRALAPTVEALSEVYAGKMNFYKVDIDEAQETAAQLGIMSVPTIILFKDGRPVKNSVGLKSQSALAAVIDEVLAQ